MLHSPAQPLSSSMMTHDEHDELMAWLTLCASSLRVYDNAKSNAKSDVKSDAKSDESCS